RDLAATFRSQRAVTTGALAAAVTFLFIAFPVGQNPFKRQKSFVTSFFDTFITVFFFVENKTFAFGFVLAKVGDVCVNAFFLAILQRLTTAVACICKHFFGLHLVKGKIF